MNIRELVDVDPQRMSGVLLHGHKGSCHSFIRLLKAGDSVTEFLRDFPSVAREQALGVLELMKERLLTD